MHCIPLPDPFLRPRSLTPMAAPPPPLERAATLSDVLEPSPPKSSRRYSWAGLKSRVLTAAIGGSAADAADWSLADLPASFFDLAASDAKGAPMPLSSFRGQVCLVTNVATN